MKHITLFNRTLKAMLCALFCLGAAETQAQTYKLVTSTDELETGCNYIIASENKGEWKVMTKYESGNNCKEESATYNSGTIVIGQNSSVAILSLTPINSYWKFQDQDNRYMSTDGTGNCLKFNTTYSNDHTLFTITFDDTQSCVITSKGTKTSNGTTYHPIVQYNDNYKLFSSYKSGQKSVFLYKEENKTLTSISIEGNPAKSDYTMGEEPSAAGLKVTATYDDKTTQDITANVTWTFTPATLEEEGTTSVTATAEYQGKTVETTFNVTVKKPASITGIAITGIPTKTTYTTGEKPSADGLTVTANYDDGTSKDVTSEVTWTFDPETIDKDTKSITATATYNDLTASTSIDNITVTVSRNDVVELDLTKHTYTSASEDNVTWEVSGVTMTQGKGTSNYAANSFIKYLDEEGKAFSRMYVGHSLTISSTQRIAKIVFEGTNSTEGKALSDQTIDNATIQSSGNIHTLIPIDDMNPIEIKQFKSQCRFTKMTVYKLISAEITDAKYATLCLPYTAQAPEGVTVYGAKDNGNTVTLIQSKDNRIEANTGVVLFSEEAGIYDFKAVYATDGYYTIEGNDMTGILKDTPLNAENNVYLLSRNKTTGKVAFRLLATDYTMEAYRAYLKPATTNPSRMMIDVDDAIETGIEEAPEQDAKPNATVIYNLAGQKLSRAQKGINIVNGKLIIK